MVTVKVPSSDVKQLPIGAIVVVEVRGRVTGMHEYDAEYSMIEVDGVASVRPGTLNDAATLAVRNAKSGMDPYLESRSQSQQELRTIP